jgi:magnesium-transporting ATPase (P-type)
LDADTVGLVWQRLDTIPFESAYQYMATLHKAPQGTTRAWIEGSAEAILSRAAFELCTERVGDANRQRGIPGSRPILQAAAYASWHWRT